MLFYSILLSVKKISTKFYVCSFLSPTIIESFIPMASLKIKLAEDSAETNYFSIFYVKPLEDVYDILVEDKNQFTQALINLKVGTIISSEAPTNYNQFEWCSEENKLIIATGSGLSIFYNLLKNDLGINKTWIIYASDDPELNNVIDYFTTAYNQHQITTHYYKNLADNYHHLINFATDVINKNAITRVLVCTSDDDTFANALKHLPVTINK